jgi:succinoglycan biosynthesis protein ExoO
MASRPVVSVITPAYNAAPYIGQCIESVRVQTLSDWEMIIVDDASTDDTTAVVQRYLHDTRIRLFRNEQNMGPSDARNRALAVAQGAWIAVLDADDWIAPERLEKLVCFAEAERVEIVADPMIYYTEWGYVYSVQWAAFAALPRGARRYSAEEVIRASPSAQPIVRHDFWRARGIRYQSSLRLAEDYALFLEIILKGGQFALLPEPMYYYRIRPNTSVTRYGDGVVANQAALEYLLRLPETTPQRARLLRQTFRRRYVYAMYPRFAQAVKTGAVREACRLLHQTPELLWILLTSVPSAISRRLWNRERLIDPWRESPPQEVRR